MLGNTINLRDLNLWGQRWIVWIQRFSSLSLSSWLAWELFDRQSKLRIEMSNSRFSAVLTNLYLVGGHLKN